MKGDPEIFGSCSPHFSITKYPVYSNMNGRLGLGLGLLLVLLVAVAVAVAVVVADFGVVIFNLRTMWEGRCHYSTAVHTTLDLVPVSSFRSF